MKIRPIDLLVESGETVTIVISPHNLTNGRYFDLEFCLCEVDKARFLNLIEGIETVLIQNGVDGDTYVLENCLGNTFYADRLKLGYCYRIRWANNGPTSTEGGEGVKHFINLNTPRCTRPYDPSNNSGEE